MSHEKLSTFSDSELYTCLFYRLNGTIAFFLIGLGSDKDVKFTQEETFWNYMCRGFKSVGCCACRHQVDLCGVGAVG